MLGRLIVDLWKHGVRKTLESEPWRESAVERIAGARGAKVVPLDGVNSLVSGRHGWFLANEYDLYLGRALIVYGEYAELEHEFLRSLLHPGDRVVEIGANIGSHTVGLAKTVGPSGGMVAIEPQPSIFRVLCANLALNGLTNVTPLALGCGRQKGTLQAPAVDYHVRQPHNSGGVSLEPSGQGIAVDVVPLDELLRPDFGARLLKIDVEGMERDVLEGARRLIETGRPLLYVENDRADKSKELIDWIMAAGYRLWWHAPPLFNPQNFFGVSDNLYPSIVSLNMLCVPKQTDLPVTGTLQEVTDPGWHPFAAQQPAQPGN